MKTYQIRMERTAWKSLRQLEPQARRRLEEAITRLASEPRPVGCRRLTGLDAYRLRIGNYRVVYTVTDLMQIVTVVKIGHRSSIYKER